MKQLTTALFLLFTFFASAQTLETSAIFTDNMVLQRDVQVPVWGWAAANEKIVLIFNNKTYNGKADKQGKWRILLPVMSAGGPYNLKIIGKNKTITLSNILFGDVWLASGQSNMEFQVASVNNAKEAVANATDAKIRHFYVPHIGSEMPQEKLDGGPWQVASPNTVGSFTAVGYFFAKELRKHQDVPIGLLHSSWGGSRLEPWMSPQSLGYTDIKNVAMQLKAQKEQRMQEVRSKLQAKVGSFPEKDEGLKDGKALWAAKDYADANWMNMTLPVLWENAEMPDLDGIVWFRKTIELSAEDIQKNATLSLGPIDDSDMTWVNGQKVGEMTQKYNENRVYDVPASALKVGKNVITVRVDDTGGGGGIYGKPELLYLETSKKKHDLAGEWKYKVGEVRFGDASNTNQMPMLLYNKMIYPILDFPIKGVIWYQGESNAGGKDAYEYRNLFHTMIEDWRARWTNSGNFPFLFVQLANYMAAKPEPSESDWAVLRESQSKTLTTTPNTGQAVITDIGEAGDIHPRNKQDVGYRLALAALKLTYGDDKVVYSGPVYKSKKVEGNKIRLSFDHVGSGLMATKDKYGYLKGFAIAGSDKKFVWAKAMIEGDDVIVWSEDVKNPTAVRYAWADNPDDANLYNKEGLPASPFRTEE